MDYLHYSPCYDGDFSAEEYRYGYLSSQWTKVPISYALHWHEYFEIEFCVVGEFRSVINGVTHVIKAGSLTVVSPGDFHEVHIPNQDQVLIKKLSFVPEVMCPEIATHINSLQFPLVLTFTQEETEDLNYAFDLLKGIEYSNNNDSLNQIKRRIFSELILIKIIEKNLRSANQHDGNPLTHKTDVVLQGIRHISLNISRPISADDVATRFYLSPSYYGRLFKKRTGKTVSQYIILLRMSKAYYLITNTDYNIEKIAAMVGYRSVSLFYRHFSQKYQVSPRTLRKS